MIRRPPASTLFPYTTPSDLDMMSPAFERLHDSVTMNILDELDPDTGAGQSASIGSRLRERLKIGRAQRLNSSHVSISYAVFCLKKKIGGEKQIYEKEY